VPYELYAAFLAVANQAEPSSVAFSGILGDFPQINFDTLKYLIEHLKQVAENSDTNRMKAMNLGIIFGPSLLKSRNSEADPLVALAENSQQNKVVDLLISRCDEIFEGAFAMRCTSLFFSSASFFFLLSFSDNLCCSEKVEPAIDFAQLQRGGSEQEGSEQVRVSRSRKPCRRADRAPSIRLLFICNDCEPRCAFYCD